MHLFGFVRIEAMAKRATGYSFEFSWMQGIKREYIILQLYKYWKWFVRFDSESVRLGRKQGYRWSHVVQLFNELFAQASTAFVYLLFEY